MNINWNVNNNTDGYIIHVGGEVTGQGNSIWINLPQNIIIVLAARRDAEVERFATLAPSQKKSLRAIIQKLPPDTKFNSDSESLFEIAVNMLEMNK